MSTVVRIKPHHFVDIVTAYGAGQNHFEPHPLGHAVHTVAQRLLADRDVVLEFELGADDVCAPCTKNNDGICEDVIDTSYRPEAPSSKREWNLIIDRRWCACLGIDQGERMTAREFCRRIQISATDITTIYREIPADRTAERAAKLSAGLRRFLA